MSLPELSKHRFIAIEGNIGSGKTSLATRIADRYEARLILEEFVDNPFLPQFYRDPERYSFLLELSFLAERYHQLKTTQPGQDLFHPFTVADYLFFKCLIFAKANLSTDEFEMYTKLFSIIDQALPRPDLLVYLYVEIPRLLQNIRKRGRSYEQEITPDYLQRIRDSYFDFFKKQQNMRIVVVDTTQMDFVNRPEDLTRILEIVGGDYPVGMTRILP